MKLIVNEKVSKSNRLMRNSTVANMEEWKKKKRKKQIGRKERGSEKEKK